MVRLREERHWDRQGEEAQSSMGSRLGRHLSSAADMSAWEHQRVRTRRQIARRVRLIPSNPSALSSPTTSRSPSLLSPSPSLQALQAPQALSPSQQSLNRSLTVTCQEPFDASKIPRPSCVTSQCQTPHYMVSLTLAHLRGIRVTRQTWGHGLCRDDSPRARSYPVRDAKFSSMQPSPDQDRSGRSWVAKHPRNH